MDKYGQKISRAMGLTPEPHYIPGYTGYCPQLKFRFAKSYERLTGELLTSPEVNHSSRLVLHTGHGPSTDSDLMPKGFPDSNLIRAIPGYTGFIPNRQNYFASTFSEICHKALAESYQETQARLLRQSSSLPAILRYDLQRPDRPKPPLTPIANEATTYKPLESLTHLESPYLMEDENPRKYFISGFTGHVPRARFLLGKGYPMTTNEALIQFGKQQLASKNRKTITTPSLPSIHQSVVPSYSGHLTGFQLTHLHTFGQPPKELELEQSRSNRLQHEKAQEKDQK